MIDLNQISEKQKLEIKVGLLQYEYIQKHYLYKDDSEDFKEVFIKFYLSSQAIMRRDENKNPFFDNLFKCKKDQDLVELVQILKEKLQNGMYEFHLLLSYYIL